MLSHPTYISEIGAYCTSTSHSFSFFLQFPEIVPKFADDRVYVFSFQIFFINRERDRSLGRNDVVDGDVVVGHPRLFYVPPGFI